MRAGERRQAILEHLRQSSRPVSAGFLAERFSVSRQAVVGDVALLRASGADISATPRGYVILKPSQDLIRRVACRHDAAGMEAELCAVVDQGCSVLDVIVEHPVYGQLTGPLRLASRYDVTQFVARCREEDAAPLSQLTEGVHLHTVLCPDQEAADRVGRALEQLDFLYR